MQTKTGITKTQKRLLAIFVSITFLFCLLFVRLIFIQLVSGGKLTQRAAEQWYRDLPLSAPRGNIYASGGELLAGNVKAYDVYARPNAVTEKARAAETLSDALGMSLAAAEEKLSERRSEVTLARRVSPEVAESIDGAGLAGIYCVATYKRSYPYGSTLSKVIGFTNVDGDGQNGLEGYYDRYLSGTDGYLYAEADIAGRETDGDTRYVPAVAGCDLELTIDADIQSYAESAVMAAHAEWQAKSCSAIVTDVRTGGIKALASYPSYDLNDVPRNDIELLNLLSKNTLITDVYEPGSTFKIFTTAAALEAGVVGENSRFYCGGSRTVDGTRVRCWRTAGHGSQDLAEGVKNSCNCVFMDLALSLGTSRFYEAIEAFGFGSKTNVDFFGESAGIVMKKENVKNVDLARIGFGQAIAVTPLQLITAVGAAVNGGTLYEPYFLSEVRSAEGDVVYEHAPKAVGRPITEQTSAKLRELLVGVVEDGGGSRAAVDGIKIGGKTGTAQKYENGAIASGKYVSSFVGFAPADDPKYAVLFIVDEPSGYTYYGSLTAAPYAGRIFSRIADGENWRRADAEDKVYITMPDVVGTDQAAAVAELENAGLVVETVGSGKVVSTTPAAGERVAVGDVVLARCEDST